jgi:tetratricopeptide (TPR) repeat protein
MIGSALRRCSLALAASALAWAFLHPYVADALCLRGDEYLRIGDPRTAQRYYRRAVVIDPDSQAATDRFAFSSLEIRTARALKAGIECASAYLIRHPGESQIRFDRALAFLAAGRSTEAASDFRLLGAAMRDARYLKLADLAVRRKRKTR